MPDDKAVPKVAEAKAPETTIAQADTSAASAQSSPPSEPAPVGTSGELVKTASSLPWVAAGGASLMLLGLGTMLLGRHFA